MRSIATSIVLSASLALDLHALTSPYFSTTNVWSGSDGSHLTYEGASAYAGVCHQLSDKLFFATGSTNSPLSAWYTTGVHDRTNDYTKTGTRRSLYPQSLISAAFTSAPSFIRPNPTYVAGEEIRFVGFGCTNRISTIPFGNNRTTYLGMENVDQFYISNPFAYGWQMPKKSAWVSNLIFDELSRVGESYNINKYQTPSAWADVDVEDQFDSVELSSYTDMAIPQTGSVLSAQEYLKGVSRIISDRGRYAWYIASGNPRITAVNRSYVHESKATVTVTNIGANVVFRIAPNSVVNTTTVTTNAVESSSLRFYAGCGETDYKQDFVTASLTSEPKLPEYTPDEAHQRGFAGYWVRAKVGDEYYLVHTNGWKVTMQEPTSQGEIATYLFESSSTENIVLYECENITNITSRSHAPTYDIAYADRSYGSISWDHSKDFGMGRINYEQYAIAANGLSVANYTRHIFGSNFSAYVGAVGRRHDNVKSFLPKFTDGTNELVMSDSDSYTSLTIYTDEEQLEMSTFVGYQIDGSTNIVQSLPSWTWSPSAYVKMTDDEGSNGESASFSLHGARFIIVDAETDTIHH